MIELKNISKTFKVAQRDKGILNALKSLFKRKYKIIEALKDVSFNIKEGEIVGYIGPNGAGKSTSIKIMSGILTPTSGTCVINGYVPWKDRKKYVRGIGAVFGQKSNLAWDVPVIDSYELLKDIYKVPKEEYEKNLELLTDKLELKEFIRTPLRQLSLGQRMRCEIAGALLHSPKILFLDEPTIGLDAVSKLAVREFIKEINKVMKVTVILTTHDMNDIEALTNRIILIGKGRLLYDGSFELIKKRYDSDVSIHVEMMEDYGEVSLKGYDVINKDKNIVTFKNKEKFNLVEFTQAIEKKYKIKDIDVETLGLEKIISNLYKEFEL